MRNNQTKTKMEIKVENMVQCNIESRYLKKFNIATIFLPSAEPLRSWSTRVDEL